MSTVLLLDAEAEIADLQRGIAVLRCELVQSETHHCEMERDHAIPVAR